MVFVVSPAANNSVSAGRTRVKSEAAAASAPLRRVVAHFTDTAFPVAPARVTVNETASPSDASASATEKLGVASSSVMVSVTASGFAAPLPPVAVPDTVTVAFGASRSLSTAVSVTVPVLAVAPAAIVRVVPVCVTGALPGTETVMVTASLEVPDRVAVTVLSCSWMLVVIVSSASAMVDGARTSVTVGVSSSSVMVSVSPVTVSPPETPLTSRVSFGSSMSSSTGVSSKSPSALAAPAGIVMEKVATPA